MVKMNKVSVYYFWIHMILEIICFALLFSYYTSLTLAYSAALVYDFLAFVPQGIIGDFYNEHKKVDIGIIGFILVILAIATAFKPSIATLSLMLLCIGNCCIHANGAIATTTVCEGKLFPAALFVGGGSFGVIIGRYLGINQVSVYILYLLAVIGMVLVIVSNQLWRMEVIEYPEFSITKENIPVISVVIIAFVVTTVRSFMAYAIPISWQKEMWQSFVLFFAMGFGKAAGGYVADRFGVRKTAVLSSLCCIPFLVFGDHNMMISIIGITIFSMTMSITFGMYLSVIKNNPGLAFGFTTVALFVGTLPVFLFSGFTYIINVVLVVVLSCSCAYGLHYSLK